jgi:hypothetical protein
VENGHNLRAAVNRHRSPRVLALGRLVEGYPMHEKTKRLPARFPANSKYVLESRGPLVRRYVEFPDGRRVELAPRRALTCHCAERAAALVPAMSTDAKAKRRRAPADVAA